LESPKGKGKGGLGDNTKCSLVAAVGVSVVVCKGRGFGCLNKGGAPFRVLPFFSGGVRGGESRGFAGSVVSRVESGF
jgi:hypothetical protein